jgi:hypothetical protein
MRDPFLVLHIVSGTAAMALGALALLAAARRHPRGDPLVGAYPWAVLATCSTATALALLEWSRLWWIVPLALVSSLLALAGYLALRRGGPKGVVVHGLGGSYIALVTALLVVSAGDLSTTAEIVAWIVPIALGVPLIVWFERRTQVSRLTLGMSTPPHQTESRGPKPDAGATPDQRLHHRWPAAEPGHVVGEPRIEVVRSHIYEVFSGGHFLVHHI